MPALEDAYVALKRSLRLAEAVPMNALFQAPIKRGAGRGGA